MSGGWAGLQLPSQALRFKDFNDKNFRCSGYWPPANEGGNLNTSLRQHFQPRQPSG